MPISETSHEFLDAIDHQFLATLDAFLSDDFEASGNLTTNRSLNKQHTLALFKAYFDAFSDLDFNVTEASQIDRTLTLKYAITGTHTGTFDLTPLSIETTVAPTQKRIELPQSSMQITFDEQDKVVSIVLNQAPGATMTDLLSQLGAELPAQG